MATVYDRIFADVRKDIPSVTDATVRQELFRVMDDFTKFTNIWQQECTVDVFPNTLQYGIEDQISVGKAHRLLFVYDYNSPVKNWPMSGIAMRVPGLITLYRAPGTAASWRAIISKHIYDPVNASSYPDIDEWIVQKHEDTIGRGVMARLLLEPGKPYSNPMLAQVNQRAYISGRSLARVNDTHANVYNAQAWRFPQSFAVRN